MVTRIYKDLCGEIEILEMRIGDLESEYHRLQKKMYDVPAGVRVSGLNREEYQKGKEILGAIMPRSRGARVPLDKLYQRMSEIANELIELRHAQTDKKRAQKNVTDILGGLEGLDYTVFYAHVVEGKALNQVASELGYSYDYIRRVHAEIEKAPAVR